MAVRKRRPRKHVIAAMSFHHLGFLVASAGYTYEGFEADYGFDVLINTFDSHQQIENGVIYLQLKATDRPQRAQGGYRFRVSTKDALYWAGNTDPVYLVLYDVAADKAVALHFQRHLETTGLDPTTLTAKSFPVVIPDVAINVATVAQWRADKNGVFARLPKVSYV